MVSIDRALRSNIKLRHLQLLVALDEFRHLGRTAEFLSVSQPAVSKMLGEVEEMLGLQLFDRSRRGTEPTLAGLSLLRFARGVLADYERTRDEVDALERGAAGRVRVGSMAAALPTLLAPAVAQLKQDAPKATVLIEEGDLTRLLPRLRLGELDLYVGRLEPGYAAPDLVTEVLYEDGMQMVVRPGHALLQQAVPGWADLAGCRMVVPPPWASMRVKLEQQFFRHGLVPAVDVVESASFLVQLSLVRDQEAVAIMAGSVARHLIVQGLLAALPVDFLDAVPPIGLMTLRGRPLTAIAERLVQELRAVAQARPEGATGPASMPA
ncbi:MAG: LysR family transcriptional regulator [Curvibacter sp.]|nr:LysR family transcriptional regulator [Curvibacter sp.]